MTTKGSKAEKSKVNSSQEYEVRYLADKLGVSGQAITAAKKATGSNERTVIEKYLRDKKSEGIIGLS